MKLAALILVAAATSARAAAPGIDFTKLPSCAQQCTALVNADTSCASNPSAYQSCVCQSTLLTTLKSSGAMCASACPSQDDQNKLTTYYNSLCSGGQQAAPTTTATTTTGTATTSSATSTATGAAAGAGNGAKQTSAGQSWLKSHARWVAFIVVVALFLLVGLVGGTWLKRRYDRKQDLKKANVAAKSAVTNDKPQGPSNGHASNPYANHAPPVTMSGGRSGNMNMDGGVNGIVPPRAPPGMRTRTSTLQSMSTAHGSKSHLPYQNPNHPQHQHQAQQAQHQPVAWGPHQYQAYAKEYGTNSPGNSVPPSPTVSHGVDPIPRPHTTGSAARAVSVHTLPNHGSGHGSGGLHGMRSDPGLNPAAEPMQAEICEVSPKKLRKMKDYE